MRTEEMIEGLTGFPGRGAGTDAERRAAVWLAAELREPRREAELEPFWCRPNWPLAHAWHVALGLAGSLLAVGHARLGAILILVALLCELADHGLGLSPGRRLTPERASQNVVSTPVLRYPGTEPPVRLIITANLDAGRDGLAYRPTLRVPAARLRRAVAGYTTGWAGWLSIGLVWLLVTALVRLDGATGAPVAVAQLLPTVLLVIALAILLELAGSEWSPGAGDNASGVAVAVALARALDAAPPAGTSVELVITGAGDGQGIGLRRHLRARRADLTPATTIVLGIGPCGEGTLHWLESDGPLVPLGYLGRLRRLCREVAADVPGLGLAPARLRGASPALPGRMRRLPAIALTCLDSDGLVPRSHRFDDTPEHVRSEALDGAVQAGLLLVDAIDGYLAGR
jgi:hypothetical protein